MNNDMLNELFISPGGNEVIEYWGEKLYTSQKLREKFLYILSRDKKIAPVLNKVEVMIKEKVVVPCWASKGILGHIKFRMFKPGKFNKVSGTYDINEKKMFIFLNNNITFFSFIKDVDHIAEVIIHEFMHMISDIKPQVFFNIFKNDISSYYENAFKLIFDIPENVKLDVNKLVNFIYKKIECNNVLTTSTLIEYSKILDSTIRKYSRLDLDTFRRTLLDYVVYIKMYLINRDRLQAFYKLFNSGKYDHIVKPLYLAYYKTFGIEYLSTIVVQETIFPSEIIAIASIKPNQNVYKGIKSI